MKQKVEDVEANKIPVNEMTFKDFYFDSYAHFGIHEVMEQNVEDAEADYYFDSYAQFGIHDEMLKDEARTTAYRDGLRYSKHLVKDKIVLDVGCGTGILCLFAVKFGAKHVIGIECSNIVDHAREVVKANGMSDKITLIKGKVEEVSLPNGIVKVDIIISAWMGYRLFYESMLKSVIYARDKWLAPYGHILPTSAALYVCAIEDKQHKDEKINWWNSVYGFDMSCIRKVALTEPIVDAVHQHQVVTDYSIVKEVYMHVMSVKDLTFSSPFKLKCDRDDCVHALATYFMITFPAKRKYVFFSTAPATRRKPTHLKQTIFYLDSGDGDEHIAVKKNERIGGIFSITSNNRNNRDLDISIEVNFDGEVSSVDKKFDYRMR